MLKGFKAIVFIIICFVLSAVLANYLDGRQLTFENLSNLFKQKATAATSSIAKVTNELFSKATANVTISIQGLNKRNSGESCIAQSATWQPNGNNGKFCKDWSQGEITFKQANGIYTWRDASGQQHFSNVKPVNIAVTEHDFKGAAILDSFSLSMSGDDMPQEFTNKVQGKMSLIFSLYSGLIGQENIRKTTLNLRFVSSRTLFNRLYNKTNLSAGNSAIGFYRGGNNQSTILVSSVEQASHTAIHESIHALNRSVIGYMPRWLNEGLAEYGENIDVTLQLGIIKPNFSRRSYRQKILPLNTLFNADGQQWASSQRSDLYNTSSAFIYFMMDDAQRKKRLGKLLRLESESLCSQLLQSKIIEQLGQTLPALQQAFSRWLTNAKREEHRI